MLTPIQTYSLLEQSRLHNQLKYYYKATQRVTRLQETQLEQDIIRKRKIADLDSPTKKSIPSNFNYTFEQIVNPPKHDVPPSVPSVPSDNETKKDNGKHKGHDKDKHRGKGYGKGKNIDIYV